MNYESIIVQYIAILGVYLFLNNTVIKESNFKTKSIFSLVLLLAIIGLKALSYLDENDNKFLEDIILINTFIISFSVILYLNYKKHSNTNIKKITYLKGRKVLYVNVSILTLLILVLSLIGAGFKSFSSITIISSILFVGSFIWTLYYIREQRRQNFKKEIVIIYNDKTYIEFDISNSVFFNLNKILNGNYNILTERSFMIYLKDNNVNKLVWNFYSPDLVIEKSKHHNTFLFDTIYRLNCKVVSIDLDINDVNVIL